MHFIHFIFFFIIIWSNYVLNDHIIFEQVGMLASSVTYIHVKMELDIQDIEDHVLEYQKVFPELKLFFKPHLNEYMEKVLYYTGKPNADHQGHSVQEAKAHAEMIETLLDHRLQATEKILVAIKALRNTLPNPENNEGHTRIRLRRQANQNKSWKEKLAKKAASIAASNIGSKILSSSSNGLLVRQTRFIPGAGLALGAFGTFMGLFNSFQIKNLKKELRDTQEAHANLVEVVQDLSHNLETFNTTLEALKAEHKFYRHVNLMHFLNYFNDIENEIWRRLHMATHVIQQAQNHRLAADFISPEKLPTLYKSIEDQAKANAQILITKQTSDLFQSELSYFYDGINVQLLLHVPSVPADSTLRLLKLHPFPLPLNKHFSVIPLVTDDLLAISPGFTRYSSQLSSVDLLGCHSINNVYLCERHGVLSKQLNNSCLGALYLQDFDLAQILCPLHVRPALEMVKQLRDNWFLIFSPSPQTAYISCRNGTNSEAYLKSGISKFPLSPGCKMDLKATLLQADHSLYLPDDVINFKWDWDISHITETLEQDMQFLKDSGITEPTFKDLTKVKLNSQRSTAMKIFLSFILSIIALALIAISIGWYLFKDTLMQLPFLNRFLSPQVRELIDTTPNPPASNVTPLSQIYPTCPAPI